MPETTTPEFPSVKELGGWLLQYEILDRLDEDGESAVYLARQPALDRHVLVSILPEISPEAAPELLERLRCRARLVHPLLTAVFDFGRTPADRFYLVTEHVEARVLEELVEERSLRPKTAFPLALQVCEALQIVHDLPMPHGGLDVRTILVTAEGQIKLTGIGMALTASGDPSWLVPFQGTLAHDIHALGVVLHWMFARSAPGVDGRLARDLPPAFATVIRRCLDVESGKQYKHPSDVAAALRETLRGEQEKAESTTRSRMVVASGGRSTVPAQPPSENSQPTPKPASPILSPAPVAVAPLRVQPGRVQPVVRHYQPTFFQRLDAFVWKAFSTGLHLLISLISIASVILMILFKDKIAFEEGSVVPKLSAQEMVEIEAEQERMPGAVLGALPPVEDLPMAPVSPAVRPVTLPPVEPPEDPLIDLRRQYTAAVQAAATQALEKVRLDELPFLQRELLLLQSGGDVPEEDESDLPEILKTLRQRYREVRAKTVSPDQ